MSKLFRRADTKTARKTLAIFRQQILKNKLKFWLYSILVPLNRLLFIVILPLLFSLIIQSLVINPDDLEKPLWLLGGAVLTSLAAVLTSHYGFKTLFLHQEEIRTLLTKLAVNRLLHHSDQFFASRKVGTLSGDISSFSNSIMPFMDIIFFQASGLVVNFVASLVIIAFMSPILLLPLGLATLFLVLLSIKAVASRGPHRHKRKTLTAQLNGTLADILGNHHIVRYFASTNREKQRILKDRNEIQDIANKEIGIVSKEGTIRQATLFAFQVATMTVSIWLFSKGMVSIAALIFAVTYLGRLAGSLFDITPIIRGMEQVFLDAANITEILDEPLEIKDKPNAKKLKVNKGKISFNNAAFSYSDHDKKVINIQDLIIKPGEKIGLAGHSGGGKTTLTKLLLRFSDVTSGEITIDDQNIAKVTQDSLRGNIAYVPQEPYLFHRSLRDNIAYGKSSATDEEILKAVKRANAYEFIKTLPKGLDTIVGERGVKLSGGQRQRIAIARAILKDAPILILDEATSALDSQSEKLIQDALTKLMKGRTSIVVAHRLSTISQLDRIIILSGGEIVEQGSHRQLLKQKGIYAELWHHQSGGFIED